MGEVNEDMLEPRSGSRPKAIAIIGMACRLPAGANNVENLWTSLASGQSGWSPHPTERYLPDTYYHPNPDKRGTYYSKGAHYLDEDIALFDPQFFNITAAEATAMDPQQRHLLEVSYEALENAGLSLTCISGTNMGVFVGGGNAEYRSHIGQDIDNLPMFEATGNAEALLANRISYVYDLRGPSLTIDTACSSSLAALNTAFLSLQTGESSTALVGGSVIRLRPESAISLSSMQLLSPDGKSYAFDERATSGFGRGEGSGCIILKPLDAAVRDGDPIRAVIRNAGVNQDGKTAGITMPNGNAQASLMRSVYQSAGLEPSMTDYVEAHGTGTAIGDPIEAAALGEVFARSPDQSAVVIGSIKSNIGHLEAVSGVASVIKAALMLERGFYLPNCDLQNLNPKIPFQQLNLKAHVVMEEALSKRDIRSIPEYARASLPNGCSSQVGPIPDITIPHLYIVSANDRDSLLRYSALLAEYVTERPIYLNPDILRSLAFTLGQRRTLLPWKIAIPATRQDELVRGLKDVSLTPVRSMDQPRIGLVFTGQGSQWPQMGTQLYYKYPAYTSAIQDADRILTALGASWSLVAELEKAEGDSSIHQPSISQPACTALQIALVDLLHSWGLVTNSVIGHSSGEIAAAYAAGILDMESCMAIAYYRGVVAASLIDNPGKVKGEMLAVGASEEDTQGLIDAQTDIMGDCTIACINSPHSMTISGDAPRIAQISALADTRSIWNKRLKVDVAYHSQQMDTVAAQYASFIGEVTPKRDVNVEFHSSLRGYLVESAALDTSYWVDNLVSPVRFFQGFTSFAAPKEDGKQGVELAIEIGPHSTLQGPIRQITQTFEGSTRRIQSFPSIVRKKDGVLSILELAARLVTSGCRLKLEKVNFPSSDLVPNILPSILTDLPTYQWNHTKKYWYEGRETEETLKYMFPRHDLLGSRASDCTVDAPRWKNVIAVEDVPWLRDHSIQDVIIFPMAGYLSMAMEACRQQTHWKGTSFDHITIRDVAVRQPLTMSDLTPIELRLSLTPYSQGSYSFSETWSHFKVSSWTSDRGWLDHCSGQVAARLLDQQNPVFSRGESNNGLNHQMDDLSGLENLCRDSRDADGLYQLCESAGFHYGPMFRGLQEIRLGPSHQAIYTVTISDTPSCMPFLKQSEYMVHPISLDLVFQGSTLFLTEGNGGMEVPYMAVSIQEINVSAGIVDGPGSVFKIYATSEPPDAFLRKRTFDYVVLDMQRPSHPCGIVVKGVVEAPVPANDESQSTDASRCLRIQWEPSMFYPGESELEAVLSIPPVEPRDPEEIRRLDNLSLDYIRRALSQTDLGDVPSGPSRKLYLWIESRACEKGSHLSNGKVPNGKVPNGYQSNGNSSNGHIPDRKVQKHDTNGDIVPMRHEQSESEKIASLAIHRVGKQLPAILRGDVDPAILMGRDGLLGSNAAKYEGCLRLYTAMAKFVEKLAFQSPPLRILDVGAHHKSATLEILARLANISGAFSGGLQYEITGEIANMPDSLISKLASWPDVIKQRTLDLDMSLLNQGLDLGSYDLVIVSGYDISQKPKKLANIRQLLRTGGRLLLFDVSYGKEHASSLPLAILPYWGPDDEDNICHSTNSESHNEPAARPATLTRPTCVANGGKTNEGQEQTIFEECGFSEPQATIIANGKVENYRFSSIFLTAVRTEPFLEPSNNMVIIAGWLPNGVTRSQVEAAIQGCRSIAVAWFDFDQLRNADLEGKHCVIIDDPRESYLTGLDPESFEGLKRLTQAVGILWITGGVSSPSAGLVRGLARTLRAEFQMDKFVTLAINDWAMPGELLIDLVGRVIEQSLYLEPSPAEFDRELAVNDGVVCIPRFVRDDLMDQDLERETQKGAKALQPFYQQDRPLRLTITSPGFLDTLSFTDDDRLFAQLPKDEIEIQTKAFGLNFKDIILALGQLPGYYLGQECSGVVTRAGSDTLGLKIGDRVCAIAAGSIANTVRCKADCAVKLPDAISFPSGASIPLIYCTAQYCLAHVARLKANETILIHAAAGGIGQAALMLAQASKAHIFATVGSQEKKEFLMRNFQIPEKRIFYSRDTSFAQDVLEATNGKGVDVVLNSLAGEQLRATWKCMAPFGRFIEIGKRDITTNMNLEMGPFEHTVTFAGVDLGDLIQHRPQALQDVFLEVMDKIRTGAIKPVSPIHEFAVADVETAFRSLQSGRLVGKVVIVPRPGDTVMASRPPIEPAILHEDISYLITGGTGGIGRAICVWMAQNGARNIILASRSGQKKANITDLVKNLAAFGINVKVCQCDVADEANLQLLISDCAKIMPPIGGVIHGAYVNKDVTFELAAYQDWLAVVQPKYQGAWNMHKAFLNQKLDFFIMLSSISAVIGNRGQAAYAAANSFLDEFAHYRASQGLPGTSINLGVVKEIGHVAERPELQEKLEALNGGIGLSRAEVLGLIKLAITKKVDKHADHQCIAGLSFENYNPKHPAYYWATDARFCHLRRGMSVPEAKVTGPSISTKQALKKAQNVHEASEIASKSLVEKLATVLITPAEEISTNKPVVALGLDSLVAVEVRSWIAKELDTKISTMELMTSPSIKALADVVVARSLLLGNLRSKISGA